MYAYTRYSKFSSTPHHILRHSSLQGLHLVLQLIRLLTTRARLSAFSEFELELLHLLRPIFYYGLALSLVLDCVVSPEEEYDGNYLSARTCFTTHQYRDAYRRDIVRDLGGSAGYCQPFQIACLSIISHT
jgi:hypothetical protein